MHRDDTEHNDLAPGNNAGGYFLGQDALEQVQKDVHEQAAEEEDVCVVRVDDVEDRASQTEAHGGLESAGYLHT
jgi:hypothetical protein